MPEDVSSRSRSRWQEPCMAISLATLLIEKSYRAMTNTEQDRWTRVKGRLRSSVGEDVYTSWFARMDLESVQDESVRLSVPTRFLKSWIQAHYAERVLSAWQAEMPEVHRDRPHRALGDALRCARRRKHRSPTEARRAERADNRPPQELRAVATAPVSATHDALGGSPLDPRLTFASFVIGRSNTLAHAAARQVAEGRRGDAVMFNPLYIHAGVGLGKTHLLQAVTWAGNAGGRAQGAVSHRGKIHVRLRRRAEDPDGARLQGSAARHRRARDRRSAVPAGQVDAGRVLSHAERADRRRPSGGDRGRPAAVGSGEPR